MHASTVLAACLLLSGCSTFDPNKGKSGAAAHSMFIGKAGRSFSSRVYTGVSAGAARLSPDTEGTRFSLSDETGGATQLRLGADINSKLSVELDTSVLGAASVREVSADVSYTAATGSAIFYALGRDANRARRVGWQGYGRLGYSVLQRASIVEPFDGSSSNLVLGFGAEYGFRNGLAFRGEVSRFDEDATLFGVGVVYRLGMSARQFGNAVARVATEAVPDDKAAGVPALAAANPEHTLAPGHVSLVRQGPNASLWSQPRLPNDDDGDGVTDSDDICTDTAGNTAVSQNGCGLFDAVLSGVTFKPGTYSLTPESRRVIDDLAGKLLAFPEVRVEVQAHADSKGPDDVNEIISSARADAVVERLIKRGVGAKQLLAKGYGESKPVASNETPDGRRQNRRIQLVTLPSLTPAEIGNQNSEDSALDTARIARKSAPKVSVTLKRGEMRELADAAKGLDGGSSSRDARQSGSGSTASEPAVVDFSFEPVLRVERFGLGGPLEGVDFKPGTTEFADGAEQSLDSVVNQLSANDEVRVALLVHVSEAADTVTNLALSREQAKVLVDYLASRGIDRDRLSAEPYGDTLPLSQTVNEDDRNRNRRVELRVTHP